MRSGAGWCWAAANATGQLLFLPFLARLVTHYGWRSAVYVVAAIAGAVFLAVFVWLKDSPSDVGLLPYGARPEDSSIAPAIPHQPLQALAWAAKSREFWILAGSFFVCGASTNGLIGTHLIPACMDHGIPEVKAAGLLAVMGVFDLFGTTFSGWLTDRFNSRYLLFWYYALRGLSLLFLPYSLSHPASWLSFFAVFYGLDWVATVPPTVRLTANTFGKENVGVVYGWIGASHQLGASLAALTAGTIRTYLGDYRDAFWIPGVSACSPPRCWFPRATPRGSRRNLGRRFRKPLRLERIFGPNPKILPLRSRLAYYLSAQIPQFKNGWNFQMNRDPKRKVPERKTQTTNHGKRCPGAFDSEIPPRREFLRSTLLGGLAAMATSLGPIVIYARELSPAARVAEVPSFELEEVTIAELQDAMKSGKYTARSITEKYLARIEQIDKQGPALNSIIELNPDALAIADALDKERKDKGPRGPLHGIPVLIKDNIDTADKMMTTAGSLALLGSKPPKDSTVAQKLREAGAVILGKTNLSEWANIRSNHSSSGWSGRGGQTKNPYALDRNPCGSSSGSGASVAANLCVAAIGTETDGSIVCPSTTNGIVGIKPTVGLVSRTGIIPISHSQDGAGPMCRSVRDAAIVLGALTGIDDQDAATADSREHSYTDYTQFLKEDGLHGARIGVVRKTFGFNEGVDRIMEAAIETLKKLGAILVDPAPIETAGKFGDSEFTVLLYELKADLNAYLARLGPNAPVKTLKDIIDFNERNREKEMPFFGQDTFLKAEEKGPLTTQEYIDALAKNHQLARKEGIDATMDKNNLDALIGPTGGPAWLTDHINGDSFGGGNSGAAAVAGYPNVTVPAGFVHGLPVGLSFFGRAWSEPVLIRLAYAFEQATKVRKPPTFPSTVNL